MTEEAKKARREYARQWRAKNRKKIKEYMERYWERRVQQDKENEASR